MDEMSKEYQPKSLRRRNEIERKPRELAYAIGVEEFEGKIGMTHGPFKNLIDALEIVPDEELSVVVRFNADYTDDIIYRWKDDRWIKES